MNFDELKKALSLSGTNFSLKSSQLGSPSIHALFTNFLHIGELHLQVAQRTETADQVIIEGGLNQEFLGILNPKAKASFSIHKEQAEVQIELTDFPTETEWKLSDSFPSLKDSLSDSFLFSAPQFNLDSQLALVLDENFQVELGMLPTPSLTAGQSKQGLSFQSNISYSPTDSPISLLLGAKELSLSGAIAYLGEDPILQLEAELTKQNIGTFTFPFKLQLVSLLKSYDNTIENSYTNGFARLQCDFQKTTGTTTLNFPIGASIYGQDPSMLLIDSYLEKNQEIKFADLADLFGVTSVDHIQPEGFPKFDDLALYQLGMMVYLPTTHLNSINVGLALNKEWEVFSKLIKFHDLKADLTLDLTARKPEVSAKVSAKADLANATIDGHISLPEQTFACYLEEGKNINISELVTELLGPDVPLPHLNCAEFEISGDVKNEHYHLMANLKEDWTLQVGTGEFVLQNTNLVIDKTKIGYQLQISGTFNLAGIGFYATAHYNNSDTVKGWTFNAYTDIDTISLKFVFNALLQLVDVQVPCSVPDINISGLSFTFDTISKDFSFTAETETEIEVPFLSGDEAKIHAIVHVESGINTETNKRELSGFMEGDFTIDSSVFTLQYSIGKGEHIFEASWECKDETNLLGINTFLDKMGISDISNELKIPKEIDLNLKKVYLKYQAETKTLKLVGDSVKYGEVFLIVSKLPIGQANPNEKVPTQGTSKWEFVLGWNYQGVINFSQIPIIGGHLEPTDLIDQFHLESVGMIISSTAIKQFEIPDMPTMKAVNSGNDASVKASISDIKRKPVAQGNVIPLGKGMALVATMDLNKSKSDGKMEALRKLVPDSKLTTLLSIDLSKKSFSIKAILQNSINIPTGQESDLKLTNPTLSFDFNKGVSFLIYGDLSLHFDNEIIDVRPELFIRDNEMGGNIGVDFRDGWKKPMGIQGLTIDSADFQLGINFAPPGGINIGLQGKSHIEDRLPATDNFAFVLEIIEEVPDPLMFSFYLEEINVKTAMKVFVPKVDASSLPQFIQDTTLTDVSFYWAQQTVVIPDGSIAQPGLSYSGNLKVLNFEAHAALAIDQDSGICGEFEMSPIDFQNILAISGTGKGVSVDKKDGEIIHYNKLPDKSKTLPDQEQTGIEKVQLVAPGGPTIKFQTVQSPFLKMSISLSFLDVLDQEIEALVAEDEITFMLKYEIGDLVHADLNFALNTTGFSLHSKFGMHLKADIGPIKLLGVDFGSIHVDTGFDLVLDVSAYNDNFELKLSGEFDFEGARLHFPEIVISFALKSLTELPGIIIEHLIENAGEIFAALLEDAGKLLEEGIKEVGKLAVEGAKEVAQLAIAAEKEAEKIIGEAGKAIVQGVEDAAKEIAKVEEEAEKILSDAGLEVGVIGISAVKEVGQIALTITHVAEEAEQEIEQIGSQIAQEAEQVAVEVGKLTEDAIHEVGVIEKAVEQEVGKVLIEAKKVADAVIHTATEVVSAIENEAKALWNEAGELAKAIAKAAEDAANAVGNAAKGVWHTITKY